MSSSPPIAAGPARPLKRRAGAGGLSVELLAAASLVPVVAAIAASFAAPAAGTHPYVMIWGTAKGWGALWTTLAVSAPAAAIATVLAAAVAHWASRLSPVAATLAAMLTCLPLLVPSPLVAAAWIAALGRQGVVTLWWQHLTGAGGPDIFSRGGAAVVLALRYFGVAALILTHHRLRQQGNWPARRVFRPGTLAAAWHLHLRGAFRPALAAAMVVALLCMNDHIIPDLLLVNTYGTQVLILYSAMMDLAGAAALAAPMAAVGAALVAGALGAARTAWAATHEPTGIAPPRVPWRRVRACAGIGAVLALALAVPVAALAVRAASVRELATALSQAQGQIWQTLRVSAAAAVLCAVLGAAIAGRWIACRRQGKCSLGPAVLLNLTVPPSLLGIGIIELTNRWPLAAARDTAWPLVLAYVVRFLPVAVLAMFMAWREESELPDHAATAHGVAAWRRWLHVRWPARRGALAAAALLVMLLAATELEVSTLLAPPGGAPLGVRLATLLHTAPASLTSALALDILALVTPGIVMLLALGLLAVRRKGIDR